jgi:hypothetical protein
VCINENCSLFGSLGTFLDGGRKKYKINGRLRYAYFFKIK